MMSIWSTIIILFFHFQIFVPLRVSHAFYSLQVAQFVQKSQSINELNKCKSFCLQMKNYFPFSFRYHRLIIRQTDGMVKYFIGHCQVKIGNQTYEKWDSLQRYINSTNLFGEKDNLNKEENDVWTSYNTTCQNDGLKLTKAAQQSLSLTRTHSNFYYYDNGSFENKQPFEDIGSMLSDINKVKI